MKTKSVIIYSGGMDSYTLLMHELLVNNKDLFALSFNYGQKHKKELTFAEAVCSEHSIPHQTADITGVNHLLISALTGEKDIPEGHYATPEPKRSRDRRWRSGSGTWEPTSSKSVRIVP